MYSSYTAAVMPRHLDLAAKYGVNLLGAVTWAFEFEDQPYFDGFRDLATNGIDKPVLNVFRMLGMMTGDRCRGRQAPAPRRSRACWRRASRTSPTSMRWPASTRTRWRSWFRTITIPASPARPRRSISTISGLPRGRMLVQHFRVDDEHSNSYERGRRWARRASPSPEQYAQLEQAGQLQSAGIAALDRFGGWPRASDLHLPLHGVSLILLTW